MNTSTHWHIWATPEGVLAVPEPLTRQAQTKIRRNYHVERSGCGNWATVTDEQGTIRLTLIRIRPIGQMKREDK